MNYAVINAESQLQISGLTTATTAGTSLSRKIGRACMQKPRVRAWAVFFVFSLACAEAQGWYQQGELLSMKQVVCSLTSTAAALHSSSVTSSRCGLRRIGMIAAASFACCGVPDLFNTCMSHTGGPSTMSPSTAARGM